MPNVITYQVDYVAKRSRLTTFFRGLLVIPVIIVAALFGIGALIAVVIAWFALLITGRWPEGLYNFVASAMRLFARVTAYYYLLTDAYPPFDGGEHPEYPVRVGIPPRLDSYSRLKVFFRGLYVIPAYIIAYVLNLVSYVCVVIAWFAIVITGKMPSGLQSGIQLGTSYNSRASSLILLLTEDYPPISYEAGTGDGGGITPAAPRSGPEMPSVGI